MECVASSISRWLGANAESIAVAAAIDISTLRSIAVATAVDFGTLKSIAVALKSIATAIDFSTLRSIAAATAIDFGTLKSIAVATAVDSNSEALIVMAAAIDCRRQRTQAGGDNGEAPFVTVAD